MFDLAWSEILVIGVVALLVIKPKDLPKVLRTVGYWVRHARQVAAGGRRGGGEPRRDRATVADPGIDKDGEKEDDIDDKKMPLLDHLIELRNRLMWSAGALIITFVGCYYFSKEIYGFLTRPLAEALEGQVGRHMIFTDLT